MDAPRLDNRTDFAAEPLSQYARDGERLLVVVKATWILKDGELALLPPDDRRGIRFADVPWGDPAASSVRYPCDTAIEKPGTDVIVVAYAHAPPHGGGGAGGPVTGKAKPVPAFEVKAAVGPIERLLRVHGPRLWTDGGRGVSTAQAALEVPVLWELAFGGLDAEDLSDVREEPRNPVGLGIARDLAALTGKPAPQLELLGAPIQSARSKPVPAGVGAIAPHWEPRRGFAGTYDAAWQASRAPLPPLDQDPKHHLSAATGMTAFPHLEGGEVCTFVNLSPKADVVSFSLPRTALSVAFEVKGRPTERFEPKLDTVLVDLLPLRDDTSAIVEMVWRASVRAPRRKRDASIQVEERGAPLRLVSGERRT